MNTNAVTNTVSNTVAQGTDLLSRLYNNPFVNRLIALVIALGLALILIFFCKIISMFIRLKMSKFFVNKNGESFKKMGVLVGDVVFYAMSFLSIYIAFSVVGIDIGLLMGGLTIGVGFAFRQTLTNMISGIMIFSTDEYKIGNIIELKFQGMPLFGVVEEINMKNVIIRTFDMRRVVLPNAMFLKQAIRTSSAEEFLRLEVEVVVDVNLDINNVMTLTATQVNAYNFVINKQYTQVLLNEFDDKKAKLKVQFYFNPNAGYTTEVLKSTVQTNLLTLYKGLSKKPEKIEKL